jgi:hypothetical protein
MGILGNCCNRISNKLAAATYEFLRATLISACILVRIRTAQRGFTHAQLNCFGCSMQFVAFVYGLFHFVMKLGANGSGLQNVHFSSYVHFSYCLASRFFTFIYLLDTWIFLFIHV